MTEKSTYIASLWYKSLDGRLTDEELADWKAWLSEDPEHQRLVDDLSDTTRLKNELAWFREANTEQKMAQLAERLFEGETAGLTNHRVKGDIVRSTPRIPLRNWFRYAAIIIIIMGAGLFIWFTSRSSKEGAVSENQLAQEIPNIPAPEGDKARLILDDGQVIALDTVSVGVLGREGNTSIEKLGDGQLAYSVNKTFTDRLIYNTIVTARGGHYQIALPDGSKVWLNAASSLRFPTVFTESNRSVELKGEAYFDIASDALAGRSAPFTVLVNGMKVQVLGTQFNVKAYEEDQAVKTTLAKGKVAVSSGDKAIQLNPAEQAVLTIRNHSFKKTGADLDKELAWMRGMFVFDDDDITDIMSELSRWYDVDVSIEGEVLNGHYSGSIKRNENISEILTMLKTAGGINFIMEDRKIKVLPAM